MAATTQTLALDSRQKRRIYTITAGAIILFVVLRALPTGTHLSHMDFRATASNSVEFCDPLNPQFIPVVAVASPVVMKLTTPAPAQAGREVVATVTLATASGKTIGPADLVLMHAKKLHLLITDPSVTDYQHVHPEPTDTPGEWTFRFTPRFGGAYRVFADFTPVATNRSLYANTDLQVEGAGPDAVTLRRETAPSWEAERGGYRFTLEVNPQPIHAGQPIDLTFRIAHPSGDPVPMEVIMDAYAHLVAYDEARSGFAHLHPMETDVAVKPDPVNPVLTFKITIPTAGRYVIWSQVLIGGTEIFTPFWFDVLK